MTIAQQLNVKHFPFEIKDNNKRIYQEESNGFWIKRQFDADGNIIHHEESNGFWWKREYDTYGKITRYEDSKDFWSKWEYDAQGNQIYYENSTGTINDNRPKVELSMDEIAQKFGINVNQLKIKK